VLFELLCENNWHVLASGFLAVTSEWAILFFLFFNIVVNVIVMNVIGARCLLSSDRVTRVAQLRRFSRCFKCRWRCSGTRATSFRRAWRH
jgi:hypothetical protein